MGNFKTCGSDFNFGLVNAKKTFAISMSGMYKKSDKANLKGPNGDNNWTYLMDNFENDYAFDVKAIFKDFTWGINYMLKQPATVTNIKSVGTIYKDYGTLWNMQFINNYFKYQKSFTETFSYTSILYNCNTTVLPNSVYYVLDTAQVGYYRPNNLIGLENIFNYKGKKTFSFTGGVTFEFDQLAKKASLSYSNSPEQKPLRPADPVMLKNYLLSVFAEPRLVLFKSLYLSGGLRFDESSVYKQVLTPRAGISYNLKKQIIRLSYSEEFRASKPWDYTDGIGNENLLPEKLRALELAFSFNVKDKVRIDVVGYRNYMLHSILKELTDTLGNYRWANSGHIDTYGLEFSLRFELWKFKTDLNYTYTQSEDEPGNFVNEISRHTGNVSLTYSINDNFKINLHASYVGKRENPQLISATNSYFVDPYFVLYGAITLLNFKGIAAQISVKNILNSKYYHTSNRTPERYRQPQFTVLFTVGYTLK